METRPKPERSSDLARGEKSEERRDDSRSDNGRSDDGSLVLGDVVVVLGGLSGSQREALDGEAGVGELGVAVSEERGARVSVELERSARFGKKRT